MNRTLAAIAAAVAAILSANANAHGCSGSGACQQISHQPSATASTGSATSNSTNTTSSTGGIATQDQWQTQRAEQGNTQSLTGSGNSNATISPTIASNSSDNRVYSSRHIDLVPVATAQPFVVTPTAYVSRYAGACGPRMVIRSRAVEGAFFGAVSTDTMVVGEDHQILAAPEAYRVIEIIPGLRQVIGHRLVETSSVVTISGGRSIGIAGANTHGGGSGTVGGAGGMQRLVTTVRLEECVAYELRAKPAAPTPVKRKVKRTAPRPVQPACNVCTLPAAKTTTTTTTTTVVTEPAASKQ